MNVLCICPREVAVERGAGPLGRPRDTSRLRYWWPGLGLDTLRGLRFDVVAVTIALRRLQWQFLLAHCTTGETLIIKGALWSPEDLPGWPRG